MYARNTPPLAMITPATLPIHTAAMLGRIRSQCQTQRSEWQDSTVPESSIPVSRYTDHAVFEAERRDLFKQLPLIAAHSSELRPGQVLTVDQYEQPVVLSRDNQGAVFAHLNVCRHRGTRLVGKPDLGAPAPDSARTQASMVCPYHGWAYELNGTLRHRLHADSFDASPCSHHDLVRLPCAERHGLIWISLERSATLDLDRFLSGLNDELPFYDIAQMQHFRTVQAQYPANWKLIVDAFLESYHIRVLHKNTIYPFFTDGITASMQFGPHIHSLVARRSAQVWAASGADAPNNMAALCQLVTPSSVIFPNTIAIWHPDYLSLISLFPTASGSHRWTHRMLIPKDKVGQDWTAHWEKTFALIEQGVFQKEDIATAVSIQNGFASGANTHLRVGRIETGLQWFHNSVALAAGIES